MLFTNAVIKAKALLTRSALLWWATRVVFM